MNKVIQADNFNLITLKNPKSPSSEAYRTLRTNIQFSSFDKKAQVIFITSSGPGEGKSTVAANLAVVMAESGSRTILVDCDQRKPRVHKNFNLSNVKGLSNYLAGEADFESCINETSINNLAIMTSGVRPPNPAELLGSKKMVEFVDSLRQKYDFVILDTPPVLMVTDAQLLSRCSDGCLLVVSSGEVAREGVIKAKELLEKVNTKILGVVLNKVQQSSRSNYGYYYYYYYDDEGVKHKHKKKKK